MTFPTSKRCLILSVCSLFFLFYLQANAQIISKIATRFYPANDLKYQNPSLPDTIKILAVRVDFGTDNTSITNGTGKFNSAVVASPQYGLDPPPRNRYYFEKHLLAVSNYYQAVSRGKAPVFTYQVFPTLVDSVYHLSKKMKEYNPSTNAEAVDDSLAILIRDTWTTAATDTSIHFSRFNTFVIFHAGAGQDFDFDFDPSPNDIPSGFFDLPFLKKTLGNGNPTYDGFLIGGVKIQHSILLPETENQPDQDFEFGLNGTIALMFGHRLGLPNLYDSNTGRSGIGKWGLMDQGSANQFGLIPAQPEAWSKTFLQWEIPIRVLDQANNPIGSSLSAESKKIYQIPIDSKEYFLLENRERDHNRNQSVSIQVIPPPYTTSIPIDVVLDNSSSLSPINGVVISADEYDWGIPGSGILIWHVDENVIEMNLPTNSVNSDPTRKGVYLEEADGAQDIGQKYDFLQAGYGSENGIQQDAFYQGNNSPLYKNNFDNFSTPSSRSNRNGFTGIRIFNFTSRDSVMAFDVTNSIRLPNFPVPVDSDYSASSLHLVSIFSNQPDSLFLVAQNQYGKALLWNLSGTPLPYAGSLSRSFYLQPFPPVLSTPFFQTPAIANMDADPLDLEIITSSSTGRIIVWKVMPGNQLDTLNTYLTDSRTTTSAVIDPLNQIWAGTENGKVYMFPPGITPAILTDGSAISGIATEIQGGSIWVFATTHLGSIYFFSADLAIRYQMNLDPNHPLTPPVFGDLNRDGNNELIVGSESGKIFSLQYKDTDPELSLTPGFPISLSDELNAPIVLADIRQEGQLKIIAAAGRKIYAFNHNGTLLSGFPLQIPYEFTVGKIISSPIIGDVNNDGSPDILISTDTGIILAMDLQGRVLDTFPRATGQSIAGTPTMASWGGNKTGLFAISSDQYLYGWSLPATTLTKNLWIDYLGGPTHNNFARTTLPSPVVSANHLLLKSSILTYPNPSPGGNVKIRYYLQNTASIKIKIFNILGQQVTEIHSTGEPLTDNESIWDTSKIASGIYFAKIEAHGSNRTETAIIKMAIIK